MAPGTTVEDSPLEMLLKEQGTLQTPVGVFSAKHAAGTVEPEQAKFYKQLLPLSKPKDGEQFSFKVDLDKCTGCKACVSACHSLNGLEDDETWRDVGTIHGFDDSGSYTQTVTTACHHCADPACLNGCPVLAYQKDPETGIVRHLDDQCIGCQYCVLKCPYDVPKYSKKLGIVRKCDMCHSRLAEGEAPACVQACPTEAISITIVDTHEVTQAAKATGDFLAGSPEAAYTVPTTQYVTQRKIPDNTEAADRRALVPEHAHVPLVIMLVLTQVSVGAYGAALFAQTVSLQIALSVIGFITMGIGLAASTSHLGRPLGAWRAFLGLRRSWLSREIVIFGIFSGAAATFTGSLIAAQFFDFVPTLVAPVSGVVTLLLGLVGVYCSAMIYHDTERPFWRIPVSGGKFFGTTLGLGLVAYATCVQFATSADGIAALAGAIILFKAKMGLEATQLLIEKSLEYGPAQKSAMLMRKPLFKVTVARYVFGLTGLALLLVGCFVPGLATCLGFITLLFGEFLERTLFFQAVAAPKMPGGVRV